MPTSTSSAATTRAQNAARAQILEDLKDDHKRVKKAYKEFQKLDVEESPEECEALVQEVLDELTLHAALEEELLYPAIHDQIADPDLVDEAEVEHESMHTAIDQLRGMSASDEKFAARFTVLCEYVLHHVKEEENEMFPQLEKVKLDWSAMAEEMQARRAEAEGEDEMADDDGGETMASDDADAEESDGEAAPATPSRGGRGGRAGKAAL